MITDPVAVFFVLAVVDLVELVQQRIVLQQRILGLFRRRRFGLFLVVVLEPHALGA